MQRKRFILLGAMLLNVLLTGGIFALDLDSPELRQALDTVDLEFINYEGPYTTIDSIEQIRGIGRALGNQIKDNPSSSQAVYYGKYRLLRVIGEDNGEKYNSDIYIIESTSQVDSITNIRRIISGYLITAFDYSPEDAHLLSKLITIYNAIYRGDMDNIDENYVSNVADNVSQENVGLARVFSQWAGKTRILIPLRSTLEGGPAGLVNVNALTTPLVMSTLILEEENGSEIVQQITDKKDSFNEEEQKDITNKMDEIIVREEEILEEIIQKEDDVNAIEDKINKDDLLEEEVEQIQKELKDLKDEINTLKDELEDLRAQKEEAKKAQDSLNKDDSQTDEGRDQVQDIIKSEKGDLTESQPSTDDTLESNDKKEDKKQDSNTSSNNQAIKPEDSKDSSSDSKGDSPKPVDESKKDDVTSNDKAEKPTQDNKVEEDKSEDKGNSQEEAVKPKEEGKEDNKDTSSDSKDDATKPVDNSKKDDVTSNDKAEKPTQDNKVEEDKSEDKGNSQEEAVKPKEEGKEDNKDTSSDSKDDATKPVDNSKKDNTTSPEKTELKPDEKVESNNNQVLPKEPNILPKDTEEETEVIAQVDNNIYFTRIIDGPKGVGQILLVDANTREILAQSDDLNILRGSSSLRNKDLIVVALEKDGARVKSLDPKTLKERSQAFYLVHARSVMNVSGDFIYLVVEKNNNWYLARFGSELTVGDVVSEERVLPTTEIRFQDKEIFVENPDGEIIVLDPNTLKRKS